MRMRRNLLALALAAIGLTAATMPASASATTSTAATIPADGCSATFFHDDPRLGPRHLPEFGPVGHELRGYDRTGGMPASQFLGTFYNPAANGGRGGWNYPPDNGYLIGSDGNPIEFQLTMVPGSEMDRYGSQYGSFLAPTGLPYAERSIPPQSLDSTPAESCNYHNYEVVKAFSVDAGPIAPWFAQPGRGLQYQLDSTLIPGAPSALNVLWLLNNGYLKSVG